MIQEMLWVLGLVIFASVIQKNYKIPSPITLIVAVVCISFFHQSVLVLNDKNFDQMVFITLPLLIAADAMKLRFSEIKEHGFSIFWVAVISVILSVLVGALFKNYILYQHHISVAGIIMLMCMVSATDPITVSAIFSNFQVPHKLKLLTEGESLFNDATALIIFSLAILSLQNPESITAVSVMTKTFSVIFGAIGIGLCTGFITNYFLKASNDPIIETFMIIFAAYFTYIFAEAFHFSGILAVIVCILMIANTILSAIEQNNEAIEHEEEKFGTNIFTKNAVAKLMNKNVFNNVDFGLFKHAITTKENHETIIKNIDFISMFASTILFISIASVVDFNKMMTYKYEILSVFIASTIIRAIMMFKFALLSNTIKSMQNIKMHWWAVLTFAGSKGALSILMVHMIPNSFEHKEMFEHIIIGNIILSIFVYAIILIGIFKWNKNRFLEEYQAEH